jgi:hypothetical protein
LIEIIFVLFTVMMGQEQSVSIHKTKSECELTIAQHKELGLMDTSKMRCVEYVKKK